MSMKILVSLVLSLTLISCASVKRTDIEATTTYSDVKTAALATKPLIEVKYSDFVNVKISDISPSVSGKSAPNKFEVISLAGVKDQAFTVVISSLCDCLGFRKWTVYPVAYMFDSAGGLVANEEKIVDPKVKILKGTFPNDGVYKIVVIADNTNKGKKIGEAIGYLAGVPVFAVAETIHPTGLIQVNWQKQK
jgi:hypothetical protein